MPISNREAWDGFVKVNKDPYSKCCVDVAREVMRVLDERPGPFDPHGLICAADDSIKAGGITVFMAGCVAQMVFQCHSRGEEFRRGWNRETQIGTEGDEANTVAGRILNPALMNVSKRQR